jgi:hypothetical protein
MEVIMNKTISKKYGVIFLCLSFISALITLITLFVPIFKIDLGIASGSETAMNFLLLSNADTNVVDNSILKFIYSFLAYAILFIPISFLFSCRKVSSSLGKEKFNNQICDTMSYGMMLNAFMYVLTIFILFYNHDWDVWSVLTGDSLITTDIYIPFFLQLAVFIVGMFFKNHWKLVLKGRQQPFSFANILFSNEKSTEFETAELLEKYKGLYDSNVITEEEFLKKKSELLNNGSFGSGFTNIGVRDESSNADLIAKYKQLYDNGIINEDEYIAKKNELLNGVK